MCVAAACYPYITEQMEWVGKTLRHTLRQVPEVSGNVEIVKEMGAVLHVTRMFRLRDGIVASVCA